MWPHSEIVEFIICVVIASAIRVIICEDFSVIHTDQLQSSLGQTGLTDNIVLGLSENQDSLKVESTGQPTPHLSNIAVPSQIDSSVEESQLHVVSSEKCRRRPLRASRLKRNSLRRLPPVMPCAVVTLNDASTDHSTTISATPSSQSTHQPPPTTHKQHQQHSSHDESSVSGQGEMEDTTGREHGHLEHDPAAVEPGQTGQQPDGQQDQHSVDSISYIFENEAMPLDVQEQSDLPSSSEPSILDEQEIDVTATTGSSSASSSSPVVLSSDIPTVNPPTIADETPRGATDAGQENIMADPNEGDFPSFGEWTAKVLAQQEKEKLEHDNHANATPVIKTVKQNRNNYASNECGAKLLSGNTEMENGASVLNSNKDEYMISPCSAKKWFVIELCEPIQVKYVELASYELFSSPIRTFKVSLSDRYPPKEWRPIRSFQTKEERTLQSFQLDDDQFSKYIKVEMVEHFGEEHFCPLTVFRVYGVDMNLADDEDDDTPQEHADATDTGVGEATSKEVTDDGQPINLFESAKDTVMSLVKKVLKVDGQKQSEEEEGVAGEKEEGEQDIEEHVNVTGDGVGGQNVSQDAAESTGPCVPEVSDGRSVDLNDVDDPRPESPTEPHIPESPKPRTAAEIDLAIVRKLEDHEQPPSIDHASGSGSNISNMVWLFDLCLNCWVKNNHDKQRTSEGRNICRYFDIMYQEICGYKHRHGIHIKKLVPSRADKDNIISHIEGAFAPIQDSVIVIDSVSIESGDVSAATPSSVVKSQEVDLEQDVKDERMTAEKSVEASKDDTVLANKVLEAVTSHNSISSRESLAENTIQTLSTSSLSESVTVIDDGVLMPSVSKTVATTEYVKSADMSIQAVAGSKEIHLEHRDRFSDSVTSSSVSLEPSYDSVVVAEASDSAGHVSDPHVAMDSDSDSYQTVMSSSSSSVANQNGALQPEVPHVDFENMGGDVEASETVSQETVDNSTVSGGAGYVDEQASSKENENNGFQEKQQQHYQKQQQQGSAKKKENLNIVKVPMNSLSQRESAIMRLNNRMKALELNISLSNRFLEELSQRYRKQSEEMIRLYNKTMSRLSNNSRLAEEKEEKHQAHVTELEDRIQLLSSVIGELSQSVDLLQSYMAGQHIIWRIAEMFVFLLLVVICVRYQGRSQQIVQLPLDIQQLIARMPSEPGLPLFRSRRNSVADGDVFRTPVSSPMKRQASEGDLGDSVQSSDMDSSQPASVGPLFSKHDAVKKKKRRKKLIINTSSEVRAGFTSHPGGSSEQHLTTSAGLLFTADEYHGCLRNDEVVDGVLYNSDGSSRHNSTNFQRSKSKSLPKVKNIGRMSHPSSAETSPCVKSSTVFNDVIKIHPQQKSQKCFLIDQKANKITTGPLNNNGISQKSRPPFVSTMINGRKTPLCLMNGNVLNVSATTDVKDIPTSKAPSLQKAPLHCRKSYPFDRNPSASATSLVNGLDSGRITDKHRSNTVPMHLSDSCTKDLGKPSTGWKKALGIT